MAQWFYTAGGAQQGPVDEAQLKQMIASGQLASTELVWCEGQASWLAVSQIPELAASVPAAPTAYAPPPQAYGQPTAYGQQAGYAPPPQAYGQYPQQQPLGYGGYAPTAYSGPPMRVPNHMVGAVLATLFCCVPGGVVAIIYAAKVDGLAARGDIQGARAAASTASTWIWVSVGVGFVFGLLYFFAVVAAGID